MIIFKSVKRPWDGKFENHFCRMYCSKLLPLIIMVMWSVFAYFYLPKSQVISQENIEHFLDNGMGWLQIRLHFWDNGMTSNQIWGDTSSSHQVLFSGLSCFHSPQNTMRSQSWEGEWNILEYRVISECSLSNLGLCGWDWTKVNLDIDAGV